MMSVTWPRDAYPETIAIIGCLTRLGLRGMRWMYRRETVGLSSL